MSSFSHMVGQRIKAYRKSRGYTLEQFSAMINKSKATLSKYENGAITIDVDTLYDIAQALDIDLKCFLDYPRQVFQVKETARKSAYFNQSLAYMYVYDGRIHQVVRSLLRFVFSQSDDSVGVTLYQSVPSFLEPERCKHLFVGTMQPYDTITHMVLSNHINASEKLYICMLNPLQNRMPAIGLMSGIGTSPFFAPIAIKALITKEPLAEDEALHSAIKVSRSDLQMIRQYNMMVVNRADDLSLSKETL